MKEDDPQACIPPGCRKFDEEFGSIVWIQNTLKECELLPNSKRKEILVKSLLISLEELPGLDYDEVLEKVSNLSSLIKANQECNHWKRKFDELSTQIGQAHYSRQVQKQVRSEKSSRLFWIIVLVIGIIAVIKFYSQFRLFH